MILDNISARYIATCHPYQGRPYAELAEKWKKMLIKDEREIPDDVFAKAFPHAYRVYCSGRNLQEYFESLEEKSHNWLIWMFVVNAFKRLPEELMKDVVSHAEYCSVKVGVLDGSEIVFPSLTGEHRLPVNNVSFLHTKQSLYHYLHGFDNKKIYAIRAASKDDYSRFKEWFEVRKIKTLKLSSSYPLQ